MTPEQKLKHAILLRAVEMESINPIEIPVTTENVDEIFDEGDVDWELQDARSEMRSGQVETGINCEWSRHYESKAVAAQMPDGSWVGWTYWYGGGKHGEPEAIDWIDSAYALICTEEVKTMTVRTFTLPPDEDKP
jgi:hypothetical protein